MWQSSGCGWLCAKRICKGVVAYSDWLIVKHDHKQKGNHVDSFYDEVSAE